MAEINRFKLEWACRRGMRELDKMIMPLYQNHFDSLLPKGEPLPLQ